MDFLIQAVHDVTLNSDSDILEARNKYNRIIFYENSNGYITIDEQRFDISGGGVLL